MTGRTLLVALAAILLAVTSIRNAAVDAWLQLQPDLAATAWRGHPEVELSVGMLDIAKAMRDRRAVDESVFTKINDAAAKAPLDVEPFLVRGVQAQVLGEQELAKQSFLAAQHRDPRSLPAAYFLADHYARAGDATRGLRQIAALSRIAPGGQHVAAPYVAAYARDRSNWPLLRGLFRSEPDLQREALAFMAKDAANADAILALADVAHRGPEATWVQTLIASLVSAGQYGRAHEIWAAVSNVRAGPDAWLYDGDFTQDVAPPPFNWQITSSTVGLAERQRGLLHVIYYGHEDGPLARQLLVLPPGSYRLTVRLLPGSSHPEALLWVLRCDKGRELGRIALDAAAAHAWRFAVPAGCPAQRLDLSGATSDLPRQSDVKITGVRLGRGGEGA